MIDELIPSITGWYSEVKSLETDFVAVITLTPLSTV